MPVPGIPELIVRLEKRAEAAEAEAERLRWALSGLVGAMKSGADLTPHMDDEIDALWRSARDALDHQKEKP